MDKIANEIGHYIIRAFDAMGAEIIGDVFRWGGVTGTGYGAIFIVLVILVVIYIVKK